MDDKTYYMHWISLLNFVIFLYSENYIEKETFDKMHHHLMTIKIAILDADGIE